MSETGRRGGIKKMVLNFISERNLPSQPMFSIRTFFFSSLDLMMTLSLPPRQLLSFTEMQEVSPSISALLYLIRTISIVEINQYTYPVFFLQKL